MTAPTRRGERGMTDSAAGGVAAGRRISLAFTARSTWSSATTVSVESLLPRRLRRDPSCPGGLGAVAAGTSSKGSAPVSSVLRTRMLTAWPGAGRVLFRVDFRALVGVGRCRARGGVHHTVAVCRDAT
jgi:hypothetical protein